MYEWMNSDKTVGHLHNVYAHQNPGAFLVDAHGNICTGGKNDVSLDQLPDFPW
jgi:hypothetical protein